VKVNEQRDTSQGERTLAGLAHASILLGLVTSGVGGILAALVIWLTQKGKSAYAAAQALQALIYQAAVLILTTLVWCCWGLALLVLVAAPMSVDPAAYESAPPATLWLGMALMIIPIGIWGLAILYALYGAARCFGGHDFAYAVVGPWLKDQ
jgi:uncharacterized Tic20 family protein